MRHYSPFEDAACPLSVAFEVLLELVSERRQVAVADQGTDQLEQAEVDVAAPLVAGAQPLEGVQPGEAALDDPALLPSPEPWAMPRRAIRGGMPCARSCRRYLSWS